MNAPVPTREKLRLILVSAIAGAAALGIAILLGAVATIELGLYDPVAIKEHGPIMSWAAHTTFIHATQRAERGAASPTLTPQQARAGAAIYAARCQMCHGDWGKPRAAWVAGINPTPPFLLDSKRRWTAPELHRIIADGVKMTAMPAWSLTLSDSEVWSLVAFLETPEAGRERMPQESN